MRRAPLLLVFLLAVAYPGCDSSDPSAGDFVESPGTPEDPEKPDDLPPDVKRAQVVFSADVSEETRLHVTYAESIFSSVLFGSRYVLVPEPAPTLLFATAEERGAPLLAGLWRGNEDPHETQIGLKSTAEAILWLLLLPDMQRFELSDVDIAITSLTETPEFEHALSVIGSLTDSGRSPFLSEQVVQPLLDLVESVGLEKTAGQNMPRTIDKKIDPQFSDSFPLRAFDNSEMDTDFLLTNGSFLWWEVRSDDVRNTNLIASEVLPQRDPLFGTGGERTVGGVNGTAELAAKISTKHNAWQIAVDVLQAALPLSGAKGCSDNILMNVVSRTLSAQQYRDSDLPDAVAKGVQAQLTDAVANSELVSSVIRECGFEAVALATLKGILQWLVPIIGYSNLAIQAHDASRLLIHWKEFFGLSESITVCQRDNVWVSCAARVVTYFRGQNQVGRPGTILHLPIEAVVRQDPSRHSPLKDIELVFDPSGSGSVSQEWRGVRRTQLSRLTDSDGIASVWWTLGGSGVNAMTICAWPGGACAPVVFATASLTAPAPSNIPPWLRRSRFTGSYSCTFSAWTCVNCPGDGSETEPGEPDGFCKTRQDRSNLSWTFDEFGLEGWEVPIEYSSDSDSFPIRWTVQGDNVELNFELRLERSRCPARIRFTLASSGSTPVEVHNFLTGLPVTRTVSFLRTDVGEYTNESVIQSIWHDTPGCR